MSDWFDNVFNKVKSFASGENSGFLDAYSNPKSKGVKMSFVRIVFDPLRQFVDNLRQIFLMSAFYAIFMTMLSLSFGFSYICGFQSDYDVFFYCNSSYLLYGINLFLRIFVISVFISKWLEVVSGKKVSLKELTKIDLKGLKTFAMILIFASLFLFPLLSLSLLISRVPNPDWRIEMAYFAVVSTGFLVPLFAVRFYSLIAFSAQNAKIPPLLEIWKKTKDNMLKILLGLFVILILFIFIFVNIIAGLKMDGNVNPIYFGIISDFIYNMLLLMFAGVLSSHCMVQKELLFGEIENE